MAISLHQVRIYDYVRSHGGWLTSRDIAIGAGVAPRTARAHALAFVNAGAFMRLEASPGHRYKTAPGYQSESLAVASAAFSARARHG
jgi:hypothetical protein